MQVQIEKWKKIDVSVLGGTLPYPRFLHSVLATIFFFNFSLIFLDLHNRLCQKGGTAPSLRKYVLKE